MNILVAPDKFKGSLTAKEACEAIREGLLSVSKDIRVKEIPLADGGEGTFETLTMIAKGSIITMRASDPLGREIDASYGLSADGKTAFIEMAATAGLHLLKPEERNPLNTSSFGTGQMIGHAMESGVNTIIMGIGGTATNDAGVGMADALGYNFYAAGRKRIQQPVGDDLSRIDRIDETSAHKLLKQTKFIILCDVNNPLYGPQGAAHIFGPQKGADAAAVEELDAGLQHFAQLVQSMGGPDLQFAGAGAAGGMGAGAKYFLEAEIRPGFEFVSEFAHLKDHIINSDLIITGEGSLDKQTEYGKVVKGVARLAFRSGKTCIALVGKCTLTPSQWKALHLTEVVTLVNQETDQQTAIENAFALLKERAASTLRRWLSTQ